MGHKVRFAYLDDVDLSGLVDDDLAQYDSASGKWKRVAVSTITGGVTGFATPSLTLSTTNAAGSATTGIRSDATIALFDATAPSTSAVGDAATVGTAAVGARRDHKHGRESFAAPSGLADSNVTGSSASVPHADHQHKRDLNIAKAGSVIGTRNKLNFIEGSNVTITVADNAGSDSVDVTIAASGGGSSFATPAIVLGTAAAGGSASTVIRSDATIQAFDSTAPVTQAVNDAAATGSVAYAARRDHKHGMPNVFGASGGSHASGFVPDPGSSAGSTKFLREDGTWTVPSGTGASTADHFVTTAVDGDLSANTVIPGFAGSPDVRAGGGNDVEFDSSSTTGWSSFAGGGAVTFDFNTTAKSFARVKVATNGSADKFGGIIHAAPSVPYTVTARLSDCNFLATTVWPVLFVSDSSTAAGNSIYVGLYGGTPRDGGNSNMQTFTGFGSSGAVGQSQKAAIYLRLIVHAANNIDTQVSYNGFVWYAVRNGLNQCATAGYFGLAIDAFGADCDTLWDWVRFS